jgi:hypothetical protein
MLKEKWLNLFLHFSGYIFLLKEKIVKERNWMRALPNVFLLLLAELLFLIISLPLYLMVSPKKIQESGFVFPKKDKEPVHLHIYVMRRKITLVTIFTAGGIFLSKVFFVGLVSTYLLGAQALLAASQSWDFNTPSDYTYTAGKIAVTGGAAQLVDQGTGGNCSGTPTACTTFVSSPTCVAQGGCTWNSAVSGATTNPDFSNFTNWAGADWLWSPTTETWVSTGGNSTGNVQISVPRARNIVGGGYWRQAFTTTVANPTVTVSFDWKNIAYTAGGTVTAYVFVDSGSGVPTISTNVWSQIITGNTSWATVANINASSRVTTAGTYYLKVAYYVSGSSSNLGPFTIGFDNVSLNWSKAGSCSGTPTACTTFVSSPTCVAQVGCAWNNVAVYPTNSPAIYPNNSLEPVGVTSWNSFSETATKGTGEIYYQLSNDDGTTWKYWNGTAWVTSVSSTNYNTALVINTNISTFSAVSGKIKWKAFLVSNGSQQIVLDNVAVGYTQNALPILQNISVSQNTSSGYVNVNYNLQDGNSDPSSLINHEYSFNGIDWQTMTEKSGVGSDGISGLSSSPSGVAHIFVWDAGSDLGNIFSNSIYIRLRADDGIISSNYLTSSAISVDYVLPVVSGVTALQVLASTNVQINYDLIDDTNADNLVELQISDDGGLTWAVPVPSVNGDVSANVFSGNGKSIVWLAGTDFSSQEKNNMMVKIRAKDKYQNQGSYIASASFVLDNRAPIISTPVNLLAQPLAGASAVLVGGSFAEGNPNTNNFYVAINGSSYGSSEAGDTNTATPTDKSVPVGTTLKGNEYISSVKIEHTDDFGQMTTNENTSPNSNYKYVRPYTPPAPTISNPGESSLDVTINKHSDEADGLEYAIFENTQSLFVQSDGSLGSEYWQAVGTITVIGLSQPISQYNFKVKSRNTSDSSHSVFSESDYSSGASSDYQSPQIIINTTAQTINGTKYVAINYTGTDFQDQANNLVKYEYSLNGTDWQTMTEKSGAGSDGISGLLFNNSGTNLVFTWDVGVDLPNVEDSSVYIRLQSNDSITNSNTAASPAFVVNTAGPVASNIQAVQEIGTNNVLISYDLSDGAGSNNTVDLFISDDSGVTYSVATSSANTDVGGNVTAGLARSIEWNAGVDFAGQEKNTMRVKIIATDSYGNEGSPLYSADFSVDTKAPIVSDVVATQTSGSALVAVTYNLADLSSADVEFGVSNDSGASWSVANTTYTGDMGLGQVSGNKTFNWNAVVDFPDQESETMRIRVRALDLFGHQGLYKESDDFIVNTKMLSISDITAVQTIGTKNIIIRYDLNKTATINLDISSNGGVDWDVATTTLTGQVNTIVAVGKNKTINWNPGIDFNNEEKTSMRVRLRGTDSLDIVSAYYESADFSVDTASPLGLLSLSKFASTNDSATVNWSAGVADASFSHYELWHGANQNDVINRTGAAQKWSVVNDSNLGVLATISTIISSINLTSDYFVKIWVVDIYGNESTITDLNVYSGAITIPPVAENISGGGGVGGVVVTDITSPGKPILTPLASPTNISSVTISGLAESGTYIYLYDRGVLVGRLNETADANGQFSQAFNLSEGEHILTVKAIDFSANLSDSSDSVILNIITKSPEAPVVLSPQNDSSIIDNTPILVGVSVAFAKIEIILDKNNMFTTNANNDGAWQFKLPADYALVDGAHNFVLKAIDLAGNKSVGTTLLLNKITSSVAVIETILPPVLPPAELVRENMVAVELPSVPIPEVTNVNVLAADNIFTFTGKALPGQEVLVYIHSDQALIYRAMADINGIWKINHSQAEVELSPGEHTIFAVAIDPIAKIKSPFTVNKNFWVSFFERLNLQTTVVTLIIILLSMLWLYNIKKRKLVNV